jgi:type I restriction enzyme M protein
LPTCFALFLPLPTYPPGQKAVGFPSSLQLIVLKKSVLYSSLWKSCGKLRGSMDDSQYKNYVLVRLFIKYVADKYARRTDALLEVPEGGSFHDMALAMGQKDIGDRLNKIISKLAEANGLSGVLDVPEVNLNDDNKLGDAGGV